MFVWFILNICDSKHVNGGKKNRKRDVFVFVFVFFLWMLLNQKDKKMNLMF
jgi:hypothetical protein